MIRTILRSGVVYFALMFMVSIAGNNAFGETLNPEGVNPHAAAPRKRITLEQKKAAAEAKKKKKSEIDAKKAAAAKPNVSTTVDLNNK